MMKRVSFSLLAVFAMAMLFISAAKKPATLFMVGDSTMADKEELDASPERGWGQLFPTYLTGDIVLENHARNGRSTHSFLMQGRWDEVMRRAKKGDIVIIEFGHNDAKQSDTTRYASIEEYERNLVRMVEEAEKKKMHVIIATSISRRSFKNGRLIDAMGAYPEAARRVAKRMNVPLLDLHKTSVAWLEGLGDDLSKAYFMNVAPGECTKFPDGKVDNTHLRENGALEIGRQAAEELRAMNLKYLSKYIVMDGAVRYSTPCGIEK